MNKREILPADLGEILFAAGVAQMRADALKASAVKAAKDLAYAETHKRMLASFAADRKAAKRDADQDAWCMDEKAQAEQDAEALALFNAQECMAINAGRY